MVIDRSMMKTQLKKRLAEQQANKNKGINDFLSYYEVPEGANQWNTKPSKDPEGVEYGFDIVPFIAGDRYPTNGYDIREGDLAYVLDIWVHFNVGPTNKPVPCPLKNFGLPCPLCEKRGEVLAERGQMDKEEYKKFKKEYGYLYPSRRVMYNVIVRSDEKLEAKGIHLYEISHFFMEKKLQEAAKKPRGGGLIPYPDPDDGKTIWMNFAFATDGESWNVGVPKFEDRKYIITDEEIEAAHQLDQLIAHYEYDEIVDMMRVKPSHVEDKEEEPETPQRELQKEEHNVVENDGDQVDTDTGEVISVTPGECPYGANFGDDHNGYNECDTCPVNDDCKATKEAAEMEKAKKDKPKPTPRKTRKLKTSTGEDD